MGRRQNTTPKRRPAMVPRGERCGLRRALQMLGRATEQLMQNPSEPSLPGFGAMAHGFFHEIKNGHTVIGHGGDTVFFHSEFDLLPQDGVGIFYNFNTRGRDNAVYGLRKALFDEFMNRYFPGIVQADPPPLASAAADARRIAGRYQRSHRVEHGLLSVFYLLQQALSRAIQATPFYRSAPLYVSALLVSLAILALTLLLWPISWLLTRRYPRLADSTEVRRHVRLLLRAAAAFDVLYLAGWMVLLAPVLGVKLWVSVSI